MLKQKKNKKFRIMTERPACKDVQLNSVTWKQIMNTLLINLQVNFKRSKEKEIRSKAIIIKNKASHCKYNYWSAESNSLSKIYSLKN